MLLPGTLLCLWFASAGLLRRQCIQPWRLALQLSCWLAALAAAGPAPAQSPKRVALLIGNADYQVEAKLKNPVRDAELLAGVLRDKLKFTDVRVERNLGVTAMDRAIDAFIERARGADSVVLYYSGHGMKRAANDRRNFLLPVDASVGRPGSPDVERQAVDAQRLRDRLRELGARVTLLVLDACRNGPGGSKNGDKGLARMGGSNQLLVAYATEEDQVAADGTGNNSPYAEALAQALQRPEPLLQQLDWVADEVEKMVPGQKPTRDGNLRATAWLGNPIAPVTQDNRAPIEDEAWALCRSTSSSGVACEDYLSTYPAGRYAGLARTRLRELQAARANPGRPETPSSPTTTVRPGPPPLPNSRVDNSEFAGRAGYYTVKVGDTILRVALETGQNWRDIQRWNGLENDACAAGRRGVASQAA